MRRVYFESPDARGCLQVDPSSGEPDEEGYEDEYALEDVEVSASSTQIQLSLSKGPEILDSRFV